MQLLKVLFSQKQWYTELPPWSATNKEPLLKWVSGLCDCENTLFHCCTSTLLLVGKGDKMTVGESILLNWRSKSPYFAWIFCSPIHYRKDKVFYAYTIHKSPIYGECQTKSAKVWEGFILTIPTIMPLNIAELVLNLLTHTVTNGLSCFINTKWTWTWLLTHITRTQKKQCIIHRQKYIISII